MSNAVGRRVLYILRQYPQITETYIETELRVLEERGHTVEIIALNVASEPARNAHSFRYVPEHDERAIARAVRELEPEVVHSHELDTARRAHEASRVAGVPFTLRTHSYDVLGLPRARMLELASYLNDDRCAGVLAFPFAVDLLLDAGVRGEAIRACHPVLDYERFHDESANGRAVMNVGACQPKKGMDQFVRLARELDGRECNVWAIGFEVARLRELNETLGRPVNVMPRTEHEDMPAHYKRHEWLVYTAAERTVGWPVAVAEAQASGVGVCMQRARSDLGEYVGDAGYLFDHIDEVAGLVSQPFPPDMRERGFRQAARSDARSHIAVLEDLWSRA
jgi:glycosyltransferase involved in cell wall biosynthesis